MLNIHSWTKIKLETEAKDNGVSEGHKAWSTTVLSPWSANPTSFQFDSSFFVIQKLRLSRNTGPKVETDFLAFSKCPREQQNESKQNWHSAESFLALLFNKCLPGFIPRPDVKYVSFVDSQF